MREGWSRASDFQLTWRTGTTSSTTCKPHLSRFDCSSQRADSGEVDSTRLRPLVQLLKDCAKLTLFTWALHVPAGRPACSGILPAFCQQFEGGRAANCAEPQSDYACPSPFLLRGFASGFVPQPASVGAPENETHRLR